MRHRATDDSLWSLLPLVEEYTGDCLPVQTTTDRGDLSWCHGSCLTGVSRIRSLLGGREAALIAHGDELFFESREEEMRYMREWNMQETAELRAMQSLARMLELDSVAELIGDFIFDRLIAADGLSKIDAADELPDMQPSEAVEVLAQAVARHKGLPAGRISEIGRVIFEAFKP